MTASYTQSEDFRAFAYFLLAKFIVYTYARYNMLHCNIYISQRYCDQIVQSFPWIFLHISTFLQGLKGIFLIMREHILSLYSAYFYRLSEIKHIQ